MTDPVTDRDGNTYDRSAIMQWLATNSTSPITRRPMTAADLVPNRIVRELLESATGFVQATNSSTSAADATGIAQRTSDNITAVIVLDASGSMSTSCDLPGEATGMTRIDLTKYSARVIIESLRPGDCLGLIAFSDSAYELAPIRQINTDHDKQILISALDRYHAGGCTNIYDAMIKAVTILAREIQQGEQASVFLLTDGEPTINPPDMRNQGVTQSTMDAVMRSIGQNPTAVSVMHNITINTFGYGYNLIADLMTGLTHIGDSKPGIFGFIPDATMLGTVLINAMSRTRYSEPAVLDPVDITTCNLVASLIHRIAQCVESVTPQLAMELNQLIARLDSQRGASFTDAILLDLNPNTDPNLGQVNKAVQPEHFRKWGRYYLMALATAFQTRSCLNFKDNALQCFKTPLVDQEQTRLSDIFLTATPPTPTGTVYNRHGGRSYNTGPVIMSTYLNAAGGCFGPETLITSATGTPIRITELKAGDQVKTLDGDTDKSQFIVHHNDAPNLDFRNGSGDDKSAPHGTRVICVVEQPYNGDLYKVHNGLWLTPWHPFVTDIQPARFPADCASLTKSAYTGVVYNLVLANRQLVGTSSITLADANDNTWAHTNTDTWAATLGHSYANDTVLSHPYYGSEAVIDDLKATGQYMTGRVCVQSCEVHRDSDTNMVSAITYNVV